MGSFTEQKEEMKIKALIIAFENIAIRTAKKKWIFTCCRNQFVIDEIHDIVYELVSNVRAFAYNLFEDEEDFESAPPAHTKQASIKSLEYLHSDLQLLLDIFYKELTSFSVRGEAQLDALLELSQTVTQIMSLIVSKYG